jgi:hypothetical protein
MEELTCLISTPGLCISYDKSNQWLYNQWIGKHDRESIPRCGELISACLLTHPCPKMLSDHSLLTGDWQQALPNIRPAFERLAALGVAYIAWVHSSLYSDHLAMEKALLCIDRPTVAIFDDVCSAYAWLQRMPNYPPLVHCNKVSERLAGRLST